MKYLNMLRRAVGSVLICSLMVSNVWTLLPGMQNQVYGDTAYAASKNNTADKPEVISVENWNNLF